MSSGVRINHTKKYLKGYEALKKAGMQVLVGGTVTHQNLRSKNLEKLIQTVNKEGAIFLFNLAVPCGNWKDNQEFVLRGDDRQYLIRLMQRYPMTSTDHEPGRNEIGCPSGMEKMYITPYGDVIPCPFIHISFGNVLSENLTSIVQKMQSIPEFSKYQKICVAAEDTDFHANVMSKIYSSNKQCPVPYADIYGK